MNDTTSTQPGEVVTSKPSDAMDRIADALERLANVFDNECDGNISDELSLIREALEHLERLSECVKGKDNPYFDTNS